MFRISDDPLKNLIKCIALIEDELSPSRKNSKLGRAQTFSKYIRKSDTFYLKFWVKIYLTLG